MIDYNKNEPLKIKSISSIRAIHRIRPHTKKKKLTKENKAFLRAIGLLK